MASSTLPGAYRNEMAENIRYPGDWESGQLDYDDYLGVSDYDRELARLDIVDVVSRMPQHVPVVLKALEEGQINGQLYGYVKDAVPCSLCLIGTIIRAECGLLSMITAEQEAFRLLRPCNIYSPAEYWFMKINEGDSADTSMYARDAHDWISAWYKDHLREKGGTDGNESA